MAERSDRVIGYPDFLGLGPIDPPDPSARVDWIARELGYRREDWDWIIDDVEAFWNLALTPVTRRVVWTSQRSVHEYCAFLEWVWRLGDQPYDVVDLTDIEVAGVNKDGQAWRHPALTVAMLGPETIARYALWDRARPLDSAEREGFRQTWAALKRENAPLRIVGPAGLKSAPLTAFDQDLLGETSDRWTNVYRVIGGIIAKGVRDYFQVADEILATRLVALVHAGMLEFRRAPAEPSGLLGYEERLPIDSEVRLPG